MIIAGDCHTKVENVRKLVYICDWHTVSTEVKFASKSLIVADAALQLHSTNWVKFNLVNCNGILNASISCHELYAHVQPLVKLKYRLPKALQTGKSLTSSY